MSTESFASWPAFTWRVYPVARRFVAPPRATLYWVAGSLMKVASQLCVSEPSVTSGPMWAERNPV